MTITAAPENTPLQENVLKQDFSAIQKLISPEKAATDALIVRELSSDVILINQIGHYIVNSGGKRLRPMLLLLTAKALGYTGSAHITLAAVIEFIHTATLLHDDVVDESSQRRGQDTANTIWGNSASVLVGDFLYSRAFEIMVSLGSLRIMEILSSTTTAIAEGEVLQLLNCNNPATTEQKYLEVIARKTAILFSAATQLAAVLTMQEESVIAALKEYGLRLGTAFQLVDDVLDYRADPEELGKNLGDDLAEGKPTLPLIYAIEHATEEQADFLRKTVENGNRENFKEVFAIMEATDALSYTAMRAREEAEKAVATLDCLPDSEFRSALISLALFSVERSY
jgi:octaprenyl-diphosphate synthase